MAEVEIPEAMDEYDAAGLLDQMIAEPEEKAKPRGPDGKFLKKDVTEDVAGDEGPESEEEMEAEDEPEAKETPEEAAVRKLKVKLDGMEQEVPEDEVVKGYLRQADYTRKTQAHAEAVKKFEAEERAVVRQEREEYATRLQAVQEALEALAPTKEPDWESLAREQTPEDFAKSFAAYRANKDRAERVRQEHSRVRELQQMEESRQYQAYLRQEQERLETVLPDWKDPEKGKVLREDLRAYANSVGYSDDEMDGVTDHRAVLTLNKARLYDESQKRRPTVEAKVDKALESLKPSGAKPVPKAKATDRMRQTFQSSGSVDDAAALLDTLMGAKSP